MTVEEKIRTMIGQLEVALEEIEYGREYFKKEKKMKDEVKELNKEDGNRNYIEEEFYQQNRIPNITLIRENLKGVGRFALIVASSIANPSKYYNNSTFIKGETK